MNHKRFAICGEKNKGLEEKLISLGFVRDDVNPDYVFSLGGDGTMLDSVHKYMYLDDVKFVGINYGKLGFYTDFVKDDLDIADIVSNEHYKTEEFRLLELDDNGQKYFALNEILVINPSSTQTIKIYVDEAELETFRGTGLVLSTPSGSTAYNKSLGGAILAPSIDGYQLTEMASINNRVYKTLSSSLVLSHANVVKLEFDNSDGLLIQVDGEAVNSKCNEIKIKLADKAIKLITRRDTLFLERVKKSFLE